MVEVKMGNHRFRLSDMMPNASWFYKLKHINNKPHRHPFTKNTAAAAAAAAPPPPPNQPLLPNRASYYFPSNYSPLHPSSTHLPPDPPPANPPPAALLHHHHLHSSSCSCRGSHHSASCTCNNNNNIVVVGSELLLRPILTKPGQAAKRTNYKQGPHDPEPTTHKSSPARRAVPHRLRGSARTVTVSSPTIHRKVRLARAAAAAAARRIRTRGILYESCFPVVKSSSDPEGDFRESMMEMILENQLTSSKDLEDLLACYLSLNSIHYHHIIVNVFQQIWSDITNFIS